MQEEQMYIVADRKLQPWDEYWQLRDRKQQRDGGNYLTREEIICSIHQL